MSDHQKDQKLDLIFAYRCAQCFRPFPDGVFYEFEGRKYCEHDFHVLFAPCCGKCGKRHDSHHVMMSFHDTHVIHFMTLMSYILITFQVNSLWEESSKP